MDNNTNTSSTSPLQEQAYYDQTKFEQLKVLLYFIWSDKGTPSFVKDADLAAQCYLTAREGPANIFPYRISTEIFETMLEEAVSRKFLCALRCIDLVGRPGKSFSYYFLADRLAIKGVSHMIMPQD